MAGFLIWGLIGVGTFLFGLREMLKAKPKDRNQIRKVGPIRLPKFGIVFEAKMILAKAHPYQWLPFFLPGVFTILMLVFATSYANFLSTLSPSVPGFLCVAAGWLLAFAISYPLFLGKTIHKYRFLQAEMIAKALARFAPRDVAFGMLANAARQKPQRLRLAAATGLIELGTAECIPVLQQMATDADPEVAKKAGNAYHQLSLVYAQRQPLSTLPLAKLIERYRYCKEKITKRQEYVTRDDYERKMKEAEEKIEAIVRSQLPQRSAFPNVYCLNCRERAEEVAWEYWNWVECKRCRDAVGLLADVKTVVGQIGGVDDWELKDGTLHLSLWDEASHKARTAVLDRIDIVGGFPVSYDWAVSAVHEKFNNENPQPGRPIPIQLVHQPGISQNSMTLVKLLDPNFRAT
ncbi:MAG TPA: HEAT repeat domain-containing protein [Bacteroidia bacterium]|nr:HEAT repeat domain-containing protein [Bacteroidia bacterium]